MMPALQSDLASPPIRWPMRSIFFVGPVGGFARTLTIYASSRRQPEVALHLAVTAHAPDLLVEVVMVHCDKPPPCIHEVGRREHAAELPGPRRRTAPCGGQWPERFPCPAFFGLSAGLSASAYPSLVHANCAGFNNGARAPRAARDRPHPSIRRRSSPPRKHDVAHHHRSSRKKLAKWKSVVDVEPPSYYSYPHG